MFDQFNPKRGLNFFTFSGLLLAMAALLACSFPAALKAEENPATAVATETEAPATLNPKDAPCQGLKPYNNLDELLYQIIINLDSNCLFNMPAAELEKAWNIKILSPERAKPAAYYPLSESEFYNKPYKEERDAFYVELMRSGSKKANIPKRNEPDQFMIKITKDYYDQHGGLLPAGEFPKPLSGPLKMKNIELTCPTAGSFNDRPLSYKCFWQNLDNARSITLDESDEALVGITVTNSATTVYDDVDVNEEEAAPADSNPKTAPCRGLKPFNNLDELLYQFYINLESDCLFEMPVEELEKKWDIKIFSAERLKPGQTLRELWLSSDFAKKPYKSAKDAFYVEVSPWRDNNNPNIFYIKMTDEYNEKHLTLFPEGNFPRLLPEPLATVSGRSGGLGSPSAKENPKPGKYAVIGVAVFYWLSSDKTTIIMLTGANSRVTEVMIFKGKGQYY